jgi:hypothetical protein
MKSVWLGLVNRPNKFPDTEHFSGTGIKSEAWTGGQRMKLLASGLQKPAGIESNGPEGFSAKRLVFPSLFPRPPY